MSEKIDLDELLDIVEISARQAIRNEFVPNLMVTGTQHYKAIECGIRIGSKFRSQVEMIISEDVEDKDI